MTDTIKPALTPEQWAMDGTTEPVLLNGKDASRRVYFRQPQMSTRQMGTPYMVDEGFGVELNADHSLSVWDDSWGITVDADIRHGVAALCLYGQPFGFRKFDPTDLEYAANVVERMSASSEQPEFDTLNMNVAKSLRLMAAKIAALLP